MLQKYAPGHGGFFLDIELFYIALFIKAADMGKFGLIRPFVLFGHIPVHYVPEQRPEGANCAENVEHRTPSPSRHDGHDNRRRDSRSKTARAVRDTLGDAALRPGKPHLH